MSRQENNQMIGHAGEHLVVADLLVRGAQSFRTDAGVPFDVIAIVENKIIRLQVKTTRGAKSWEHRPGSSYLFHVKYHGKRNNVRYYEDEFDGFAFVALDTKEVGYIVYENIPAKCNFSIRIRGNTYRKGRASPYMDELTWEKFMEDINVRSQ